VVERKMPQHPACSAKMKIGVCKFLLTKQIREGYKQSATSKVKREVQFESLLASRLCILNVVKHGTRELISRKKLGVRKEEGKKMCACVHVKFQSHATDRDQKE
jgi:hypothetical protein